MKLRAALLALALGLPGVCLAEGGMQVEPGKWEFQSRSTMPMSSEPMERVTTDCVTESELSPDLFMAEARECSLDEVQVSDDAMSWKMRCETPGAPMLGSASFRSTGTTLTGSMQMSMELEGKPFSMEHTWTGRRLGACD